MADKPEITKKPKKSIYVANIWMDHAPHMDPVRREQILADYPREEYNARRYGIPERGTGRVYIKPVDDVVINWFKIPGEWPIAAGLDVGNSNEHATACIFIAQNPENGDYVVFDEYYCRGYEKTFVHARGILEKGLNPPIAFDYSGNRTNDDLTSTREIYESEGLDKVYNANKAVSAGIAFINNLLSKNKLKIMCNCTNLIREYDQYYFEKGKPVKKNDDAMDSWRYGMLKFQEIAMPKYQCVDGFDEDEYFEDRIAAYEQATLTNNNKGSEGY